MWTWKSWDGRALRYWREVAFAAFSNCNPLVRKTYTSFEPFVTFMQDHVNSKYIEISTKSCSAWTLMVKKHDLTTCAIYAVNPTIRSPHASSRVGILYPCKATSDLLESRCNKKSRNSRLLYKEIVKHLLPNFGSNQRRIYYSLLQHLKMTQIWFFTWSSAATDDRGTDRAANTKTQTLHIWQIDQFLPKIVFQLSKYTIPVKSPGQTLGELSERWIWEFMHNNITQV